MGDSLPETEQINKLGSGYSRRIVYQQGPHSSGEGLLPAGPEAEITFCCAETAAVVTAAACCVTSHATLCASGDDECAWQASLG